MSSPAVLACALRSDGLAVHTDQGVVVVGASTLRELGLRRTEVRARNRRPDPVQPDAAARLAGLDEFHRLCAASLRMRLAPYAAAAATGTNYMRIRHHTSGSAGAEALLDAVRETLGIPKTGPKPKHQKR